MPGKDGKAGMDEILLDVAGLGRLLAALARDGRLVVGPTIADDAIVYAELTGTADLPKGATDEQKGGHYRLKKGAGASFFGYSIAAQGWKRVLNPPKQKIFAARRTAKGFELAPPEAPPAPMALVGVRACELAAMNIQGTVFGDALYPDTGYQARRKAALVVAVECSSAGGTCFCTSMGTGPEVTSGYDIKLVELVGKDRHLFLAVSGSAEGARVLKKAGGEAAGNAEREAAAKQVAKVAKSMGKTMDARAAAGLKAQHAHPRWDEVATRCLSCGNCTLVCPTCFCSTVEDATDLKGENAERWRRWDSCFSIDFSYIHGGAIRTGAGARYRQWITHKLSAWHDQFNSSGCVGCGRCITWCPVGIDITEEVAAIGADKAPAPAKTSNAKGR